MGEIWRDVIGYEGWYSVSNLGRVRRDKPGSKGAKVLSVKPRYPRKKFGSDYAYYAVNLCKEGKVRMWKVHSLVADAFLGPKANGMEINHKDCNALNNSVDNLEYVTHRDNLLYSFFARRRMPTPVKRDKALIDKINEKLSTGMLKKDIAKELGIGKNTLIRALRLGPVFKEHNR